MSKIYLSGGSSRKYVIEIAVERYLESIKSSDKSQIQKFESANPYVLESFFYIQRNSEWLMALRPFFRGFLLDSGAFTYLQGNGKNVNWNKYIESYAEFINKYDIDLFFELDIDSIVGIKKVEEYRKRLEELTGKKSIPVWHKSRGLEYWKEMVSDYDYVAIGGIVTKEIKGNEFPIFTPLLKMAKEKGTKVHGLGFTNFRGLKKYNFYSVDSTSWVYGNRGGFLWQFDGRDMLKHFNKGMKLEARKAAIHNYLEWCKFGIYAEQYL